MGRYIITYLGGKQPSSSEEQEENLSRYHERLGSLGEAAVQPMVPFQNAHTVHPDGRVEDGSSVSMSGYTVVEADSIEGAIAVARACPFLDTNGTLEVAQLAEHG